MQHIKCVIIGKTLIIIHICVRFRVYGKTCNSYDLRRHNICKFHMFCSNKALWQDFGVRHQFQKSLNKKMGHSFKYRTIITALTHILLLFIQNQYFKSFHIKFRMESEYTISTIKFDAPTDHFLIKIN